MTKTYASSPSKKHSIGDNRITLDAKHKEMMRYFKELKKSLPFKKKKVLELQLKLDKLNELENNKLSKDQIDQKYFISVEIDRLKQDIIDIENDKEENNYYLNAGPYLIEYYENLDRISNEKEDGSSPPPDKKYSTISPKITDFFGGNPPKSSPKIIINNDNNYHNDDDPDYVEDYADDYAEDYAEDYVNGNNCDDADVINDANGNGCNDVGVINGNDANGNGCNDVGVINGNDANAGSDVEDCGEDDEDNTDNNGSKVSDMSKSTGKYTSTKMDDYIQSIDRFKRTDIRDKYMRKIDNTYFSKILYEENVNMCNNCNIERMLIRSEGILLCEECQEAEYVVVCSDKPSPKDKPGGDSYYAYKRSNHFAEWLSQIQAKESTEICQEIFDQILVEIKKERIKDMSKITHDKMRDYLKKLKLNKYYEHIPYIIYRLNGVKPPTIGKELEEKLRLMFKEIQQPFEEVCPPSRKNFLSYSYVLYKFFELLGLDEFKNRFTLLKSRSKLHDQDKIWRDICKITKWEYIPSI